MKKIFLCFIFLLFSIISQNNLYAESNFLLSENENYNLTFESFLERRQITAEDAAGSFSPTAKIEGFRLKVGYTPDDNIAFYGIAGIADLSIDNFDNFSSNSNPIIGIGFITILLKPNEKTNTYMSINLSHFSARSKHKTSNGFQTEDITWVEYNALVATELKYGSAYPYAGIELGGLSGKDKLSKTGSSNFHAARNVGIVFGIRAIVVKKLTVNLGYTLINRSQINITISSFL